MSLQSENRNIRKFTLQHNDFPPKEITDPIGFEDSEPEFARNKKYFGIMSKRSNSLKFVKEGMDFILMIDRIYGINADLRLWIDEVDPITEKVTRVDNADLDFSTLIEEEYQLTIKANSSGLFKLMKSRLNQKIELERLDSIDGDTIPALNIHKMALSGRQILLNSLLETKEEDSENRAFRMKFKSNNDRTAILTIPTAVTYKSDALIHATYRDHFSTTPLIGEVEGLFYANNDVEKILKIDISFQFEIEVEKFEDVDNSFFEVGLAKFGGGTDYDLIDRTLIGISRSVNSLNGLSVNESWSGEITLNAGESLALQWYGGGDNFGSAIDYGYIYLNFTNTFASIEITENSHRDSSVSNCILPFEAANRLIEVIAGRNDAFYSDVLGRTDLGYPVDGDAALLALTHGHWIRGFNSEDELYKPFTTSLRNFIESYFATWNLGLGIEQIGFSERVRIEEKSFFFNRNVTVRLGKPDANGKFQYIEVSKVKRSKALDYIYSSLEFGYEKGGEYEEVNGLAEYNTLNTSTTIINRVQKLFRAVAKYRADGIGQELERRKQKEDLPTTDSKGDKHIWMNDLKRGETDVFEERIWSDDFEQEPTGVYSPETATNLRLSPANLLLRHGWFIAGCLVKYPFDYVRFGSSVANSNLSTQLIGKPEYKENGEGDTTKIIQNNALERARFKPEWIEFEYNVDADLMKQIKGTSTILGKDIPNMYGLFEFKTKRGIEKGYLWNLKPEGAGKFKVLSYND